MEKEPITLNGLQKLKDELIKKYDIPKGKQLGEKLKKIENEWVDNNFKISEKQIDNILYN